MASRTKAAAAADAVPQQPEFPAGLEPNGLDGKFSGPMDDLPGDDAVLSPEETRKNAQAESESYNRREYFPSDTVVNRLNALPKEDIKKEIGLDIDYMMKNTKKYGMLEALAFGTFTPPVNVYVGMGHEKRRRELATIRIYNLPAAPGREAKWGYEMHHVGLKYKVDENGQQIMKNGKPEMVYDRNPIKPGDIISYNGVELKPDQVDRLRLTGNLGEPLAGLDFSNKPTYTVLSVDPYNNHELVGVKSTTIAARLERMPEFKFRDKEGNNHAYELDSRTIGELSLGRGVWLKPSTPTDKEIYVQYNAATDRLQTATSYEQAKRKEREVKHVEEQTRSVARQQTQEISAGQHL